MSAVATQNIINRIAFFAPLETAARDQLNRQVGWRRFGPGDQIIDRHDETRDVFFVAEGLVRVVNYSLSGREISFDDLGPGSYFGELSALDGAPRSATVIAVVDTLVMVVPHAVFARVVAENPPLALTIMRNLAAMIRRATERIMDLSTLGANNRVHAEILRLAKIGLEPGNAAVITPIPLHGDIASRVSTTRETVARVFSDLARAGLVERQPDHLYVRDFARLERLVEEVRGEV